MTEHLFFAVQCTGESLPILYFYLIWAANIENAEKKLNEHNEGIDLNFKLVSIGTANHVLITRQRVNDQTAVEYIGAVDLLEGGFYAKRKEVKMWEKIKHEIEEFKKPFPEVGSVAYSLAAIVFDIGSLVHIPVKNQEQEDPELRG